MAPRRAMYPSPLFQLLLSRLRSIRYERRMIIFIFAVLFLIMRNKNGNIEYRLSSQRQSTHIKNSTAWPMEYILKQPFASNIIVSELNHLIYCPIPKAANTNWKYLIRKLEGVPNYGDLHAAHNANTSGLRYLSDYSAAEAKKLLTDPSFFKFVFVRDPYTRLLSCYMDKFRNMDPNYTATEYRTFVAAAFSWRYARSMDPFLAPRPSFRSFIRAIATVPPSHMNAHWRPQTLLCGFGVMPYDFVGRMEHLQRDTAKVLETIGHAQEPFPTQHDLGFPPSGASASLAQHLYTTDLMFATRLLYAADFDALGYQ